MKIGKEFAVAHPANAVWNALGDVALVAGCLPGASIVEELGEERYRGKFSVKLGPLAANFEGEMATLRDDDTRNGSVEGKGSDAGSSSRASGTLAYRVEVADEGCLVAIDCTFNLAGALAQFGKGAVVKQVADRLTAEFVANLEAQLAENASATPTPYGDAGSLDAGGLLWSLVRDAVTNFLRVFFGRDRGAS